MPRRLPVALALLAAAAAAGVGASSPGLLELATLCDVVVHGKVTEVGERTATIDVARSFKRVLPPGPLVVTPSTRATCFGRVPNFAAGDEVLVFLTAQANGPFRVMAHGHGNVPIPQGRAQELVEAAARLIEVAALNDPDRAMIALAASDNATLRGEACRHISVTIAGAKDRERHRRDLALLLDAPSAEVRAAGLRGLRHIQAPEALPRIVALAEDTDEAVLRAASLALREYDTEATVRVLARLARHENRAVAGRATADLGESRSPEALAALLGLLDDPDRETRRSVCGALIGWLWRKEQGSFAARIGVLALKDADPGAHAAAARTSWEARNPALVEPLARLLRDARPGGPAEAASLESLRQIQREAGDAGRRAVEGHLDLVRRSLRRGTGGAAPAQILGAAHDGDELRWAARHHPDAAVRGLAQCLLGRVPR